MEYFALSVRETFLFAIKKSQFSEDMSGGEGLEKMLPFCVCEELDPYMIFCLAYFQNLPQLSKVTEFNTDLYTRDRQTSSNVCLLKLKEKRQHIKNAVRSQRMASLTCLSQILVLHFSVCKKGKQKDATCTLDCNNPEMPLHTKGLYLYKSSENVCNKFNCKKISPPPPPHLPSCTVNQFKQNKNLKWQISYYIKCRRETKIRPQNKGKGDGGVALCLCYIHLLQSLQSTRFNMHKPPFGCKSL